MTTQNYEGRKWEHDLVEKTTDALTVEGALQINVNQEAFTITMRTPEDDEPLVRGLLHSEGVIKDVNFSPKITIQEDEEKGMTIANVTVDSDKLSDGYSNSRSLLSVASCGICGKTELEDLKCENEVIDNSIQLSMDQLHGMFDRMNNYQSAFKESGGSHAAAAFDTDGNILAVFEDVGRHNAVDKVIGSLIIKGKLKQAVCLTVSGRISYEIVVKCFKARIPVLAAVSAPSSLAVDFAKELGITLLAFCRKNRATCYANTQRINTNNLKNQAG